MILLIIFSLTVLSVSAQVPSVSFEQVAGCVEHGEGPYWSEKEQALYWVDISGGDVWRLHPESGNITKCHIGGEVSVMIAIADEEDMFVLGIGDALQQLSWDGHNDSTTSLRPLGSVGPLKGTARFNDGKVDAKGRLWIGTIGSEVNDVVEENQATLYKVECVEGKEELEITTVLQNVSVSNGIAWSADGAIMYYVDSSTRKVDAFDFEVENGTISNRRNVFDLENHNITGVPDGMTIDADDNLWIAIYGGGAVIVVNPHLNRLLHVFPIENASKVTSVSWGSTALDILYVTTSSRGDVSGGQLYKMTGAGVHGKPANDFKISHCKKT